MDEYNVKQINKMLVHETSESEEHYGVRLIYWSALGGQSASDTWTPTINAGELKVLIEDCLNDDTDLEDK